MVTEDKERIRQLIEDTAYAVTNHARRTSPPSATQTWRSFTQILQRFATDILAIGYNAGYAEGMRVERELWGRDADN